MFEVLVKNALELYDDFLWNHPKKCRFSMTFFMMTINNRCKKYKLIDLKNVFDSSDYGRWCSNVML